MNHDDQQKILHARAQTLAQEPVQPPAADELLSIIEFSLATERYGVPTAGVREVSALRELTPLPGTPAFVLGVINIRGKIVAVIDLKALFSLPDKGLTDHYKVVILQSPDMDLGLLVDDVAGARTLRRADLQPAPPTLTGLRAEYLQGVTSDRLAVLDVARLLADPALIVREEVQP
jgi:purine-binding chemotaxis protein CheW